MARLINRLNARSVQTAKPGMHNDGAGLYLRVDDDSNRYWVFRYASRLTGKDRQFGIGPTHTISLAEAREKARECRQLLLNGKDPLDAKNSQKAATALGDAKAMTFDQCRDAYIEAHQAGWRSAKHAKDWRASMEMHATPVFGHLPVAAIDTGLVLKVIEPMWKAKTETASRVRGRIETVLDWARVRNYRTGENPARWKGHLDHLLPARGKVARVQHYAALPYVEIGAFMTMLRGQTGISRRALEFAILTAARSGEVTGARWSEFDLAARVWTIPAARMKGHREHRVPLSDAACKILEEMAAIRHSDRVFTVAQSRLSALPKELGCDVTVHGFRSTFRDWAGERTNFPRELAEVALAHAVGDETERAYQRGDLLEKRRRLMDAWALYCAQKAVAGKVLTLRREVPA